MTTKGFSLSDFSPEGMTFTDDGFGGEGHAHDVKTVQHFGARDTVKLQNLYERLSRALGGKGVNGKRINADHLATQLEQTVEEMFCMVIPTIPEERLKQIPFQAKFRFMSWWRQEQAVVKQEAAQEGAADPKPKRWRRKVAKKETPVSA